MAATNGDMDAVSPLLAAGTDVNWQDEHGETALMAAAFFGNHAIVAVFLLHPSIRVNLQVNIRPFDICRNFIRSR